MSVWGMEKGMEIPDFQSFLHWWALQWSQAAACLCKGVPLSGASSTLSCSTHFCSPGHDPRGAPPAHLA